MTPEQRVHELTTRQIFYDSSLVCRLNAVNGKWFYKVYAWLNQDNISNESLIIRGKYEGQDPLDLCHEALNVLGVKKIKLGVPVPDVNSFMSRRTN